MSENQLKGNHLLVDIKEEVSSTPLKNQPLAEKK